MEERRYGICGLSLDEVEDQLRKYHHGGDLIAHIRELLAENAALKADAARYITLRDATLSEDFDGPLIQAMEELADEIGVNTIPTAGQFDAAVDKAMTK